jgi:hypothetical protein
MLSVMGAMYGRIGLASVRSVTQLAIDLGRRREAGGGERRRAGIQAEDISLYQRRGVAVCISHCVGRSVGGLYWQDNRHNPVF